MFVTVSFSDEKFVSFHTQMIEFDIYSRTDKSIVRDKTYGRGRLFCLLLLEKHFLAVNTSVLCKYAIQYENFENIFETLAHNVKNLWYNVFWKYLP